ncbi:MAG: hypothetical protein JW934_17560 [Anaerolineae bacterium]|nr:hypothetical protein [Anaerolineae bacterium]
MAIEYPDIMNDVTDARQRYESGAVQYLAEFSPATSAAGSTPSLMLVVQSVVDVPVQLAIRLGLPEMDRKLKRLPQPFFNLFQPEINLTLESAEVIQLTVPVYVQAHVPPGAYAFAVAVRSVSTEQGGRVRSQKGEDRLGDLKIRYPQGLGITQITPRGFQVREASSQSVSINVTQAGATPDPMPQVAQLQPALASLWGASDWDLIPPAQRELNDRRIHIMPDLTAENLYLPLMQQSEAAFSACGVRLHVGEAILLTKMLAYTALYMGSKATWMDCLMVPIYAFAQASGEPTDDVIWLLAGLGYPHVLELSIALAFSLTEEALQRQLWSPDEQRAVRRFIVECMDTGDQLPEEFVYLPLMLGGLLIADQVVFEGEDVRQSLALAAKAKAAKTDMFADPDLQPISQAFDRLLTLKMPK